MSPRGGRKRGQVALPTIFDALLDEFRACVTGLEGPVTADFVGGIDWAMPRRSLPAHGLACLKHLDAIERLAGDRWRPMASLLREHGAAFHWGQTYTAADFGVDFIDNYGWLEVFGTRGHFENDKIAAGLLLLGPDIVYPDHHHVAEEVYVPISGMARWRKGDGAFIERAPGAVIHHPSNVNHAMRTGGEPLLALYLWRGGPLAQKSVIGSPNAHAGMEGR